MIKIAKIATKFNLRAMIFPNFPEAYSKTPTQFAVAAKPGLVTQKSNTSAGEHFKSNPSTIGKYKQKV